MENLKKGFMIRDGVVVGAGGQVSKRVTQAEYDVIPDDEKNNNDVIYFITDGTDDEFGINDGVVSDTTTWSSSKIDDEFTRIDDSSTDTQTTWSSSKIASELNTSSNTDQTNITMNGTYAIATSGGHGCRYIVRNGICYVNMDLRMVANGQICTLPKPFMTVINIPMPIFMTDLTDVGNNNGILIIESNGSVTTLGAKLNQTRYMLNFSYPVE